MNAKDYYIQTVQEESIWLAIAKKIVRDQVQRLMEHRTTFTQPGGQHEGFYRVEVSQAPGTQRPGLGGHD